MMKLAYKGYVHLEMQQTVWGLPQAGILANKRLRHKLAPFSYYEHVNTPGLWYYESRPISFMLVVDNFGVKYETKVDIDHLIGAIKSTYTLTKDWTGNLYCSISLDWDYENRTVDILMLEYIKKKLQEYKHVKANCVQNCPYSPAPKQYEIKAQAPLPPTQSPRLKEKGIKQVQQIIRSILYYPWAINLTILTASNTTAVEQTTVMECTLEKCMQ